MSSGERALVGQETPEPMLKAHGKSLHDHNKIAAKVQGDEEQASSLLSLKKSGKCVAGRRNKNYSTHLRREWKSNSMAREKRANQASR